MQSVWVASLTLLCLVAAAQAIGSKKYDAKKDALISSHQAGKKDSIQDALAQFVSKKVATASEKKSSGVPQLRATEGATISDATKVLQSSNLFTPEVLSQLQALSAAHVDKENKNILLPNGDTLVFNPAFPALGALGAFPQLGNILPVILATLAAIGAGIAALIALIVPPLQIANQILAIIAIALLICYIVEDKGFMDYMMDTGYGDTGYSTATGYADVSYMSGYGGGGGGGDTSGYSPGGSSYTDYRRVGQNLLPFDGYNDLYGGQGSAAAPNSLDAATPGVFPAAGNIGARSMAPRSVVNRLARMVGKAVHSYGSLYGDETQNKTE